MKGEARVAGRGLRWCCAVAVAELCGLRQAPAVPPWV